MATFLLIGYFSVFCFFYHFMFIIKYEILEERDFWINSICNIVFSVFGFAAAKIL